MTRLVPIRLPKSAAEALAAQAELDAEYRAGGTDLQERRAHEHEPRALVDLRDLEAFGDIEPNAGGLRIGAGASLQRVADHPAVRTSWPGVAEACGALGTPQVRAVATLGGNLAQAPRCWYYRHPDHSCLRKGGDACLARGGDHLWHVCFDTDPCAAPHPSTAALALLAYEAEVELALPADSAAPEAPPKRERVPVEAVLATDALTQIHPSALLTAVHLGAPLPRERSAYVRASSRALAEWALVEVCVRLRLGADEVVDFARVTVGAVAPTPLRLTAVEQAVVGQPASPERFEAAAALATAGAKPLPMTGYKLELLAGAVLTALELARDGRPSPDTIAPAPLGDAASSQPASRGDR